MIKTIDNFFTDFEATRAFALSLKYQRHLRQGPRIYPARNSLGRFFPHEVFEKTRAALGFHFHVELESYEGYNAQSTGRFRYSLAGDQIFGIHSDFKGHFSGLVYLNTREQCAGRAGTNFYAYKRGGLKESRGQLIATDDRSEWRQYRSIAMKPNRCLLFKSELFHTMDSVFGHDLESARLTYIFWFKRGHSRTGLNCC